jgi:anti-sigma-K factor RskA
MSTQEKDTLSAVEYVLGLIDNQTRQQLDKRLNEDAEFAAEVLHWQKAFSGIDVATHDVTPSSELWQQIEHDLRPNTSVSEISSVRRHPILWLGWVLAAAMASVVIFTHVIKPDFSDELQPIAILSGTQTNTQFVVSLDKSASIIKVSGLNVTLPENKNLQLWMIKGSASPHSLGLIIHRDSNTFQLPSGALDNQTLLAISLEPVGGSQQTGPSGPVIYQGKVSSL